MPVLLDKEVNEGTSNLSHGPFFLGISRHDFLTGSSLVSMLREWLG